VFTATSEEEDWDGECQLDPEPEFRITTTTSQLNLLKPKDSFIRYVKTVYGRTIAHQIKQELDIQHITNSNYNIKKEQSLQKMINSHK